MYGLSRCPPSQRRHASDIETEPEPGGADPAAGQSSRAVRISITRVQTLPFVAIPALLPSCCSPSDPEVGPEPERGGSVSKCERRYTLLGAPRSATNAPRPLATTVALPFNLPGSASQERDTFQPAQVVPFSTCLDSQTSLILFLSGWSCVVDRRVDPGVPVLPSTGNYRFTTTSPPERSSVRAAATATSGEHRCWVFAAVRALLGAPGRSPPCMLITSRAAWSLVSLLPVNADDRRRGGPACSAAVCARWR